MSGIERIAKERERQFSEGWTADHDDKYKSNELIRAAYCYLEDTFNTDPATTDPPLLWPWHKSWWKPSTYARNLEKAGALIAAALDSHERIHHVEKDSIK